MLRLALKSLANRRSTALLVLVSLALSTALLLGVERVRVQAKDSFANTIHGADLIVGARTGPISLLLYSVFRIGDATNNIRWTSYKEIAALPEVGWTIPLSLGDSHRGFRVLGTSDAYFEHYRHGDARRLAVAQGRPFTGDAEAVVGATVARDLGYALGQSIILAHGVGDVSFADHTDHPFRVVGILAPTGTPVDRTVHVSLAGIDAMHANFIGGMSVRGLRIRRSEPANITAFIVGLRSKSAIFAVQREVNEFKGEPLLAILPGLTLQQLWDVIALGENALRVVALLVLLVSLVTMTTALLTSLQERRREMAILRALGARPRHVFLLVLGESLLLTTIAALLGLATLQLATIWTATILETTYGLSLSAWPIAKGEWQLLGLLFVGALVAGAVPAFTAYRRSVADGMSIRL